MNSTWIIKPFAMTFVGLTPLIAFAQSGTQPRMHPGGVVGDFYPHKYEESRIIEERPAKSVRLVDLQSKVGHRITLVGRFSNRGKEGAYLVPQTTIQNEVQLGILKNWKENIMMPENAQVQITGIIRYRPELGGAESEFGANQRAPACYYFDAKESKMRQLK
jgi:hypothetical protein